MPVNIKDADGATVEVETLDDVTKGAGAADAGTLRIVLASGQTLAISAAALPLPAGAATEATLAAAAGSLTAIDASAAAVAASASVLDDWDESDRAKVNLVAGQAGVAAAAGAADAKTLRAILASDDPAVVALGGAGSGGPSLPGGSSGVIGFLRHLASLLPAALGRAVGSGSLSVVPASDLSVTKTFSLQRPGNTTAYGIKDVWGTGSAGGALIEFQNVGAAGDEINVSSTRLMFDVATVMTGMTSFRLALYTAAPASPLTDNDAWTLPSADRSNFVGFVDCGSPAVEGTVLYVQTDGQQRRFRLQSSSVWAYVMTATPLTPTSAATMTGAVSFEKV